MKAENAKAVSYKVFEKKYFKQIQDLRADIKKASQSGLLDVTSKAFDGYTYDIAWTLRCYLSDAGYFVRSITNKSEDTIDEVEVGW